MAKAKRNWVQGVVKTMDKGAFSAKAKRAGMSTAAYADQVLKPGSKASAKTRKQANLARVFSRMKHKRGGK